MTDITAPQRVWPSLVIDLRNQGMDAQDIEVVRRSLMFWRWKYQVQKCEPPLRDEPFDEEYLW